MPGSNAMTLTTLPDLDRALLGEAPRRRTGRPQANLLRAGLLLELGVHLDRKVANPFQCSSVGSRPKESEAQALAVSAVMSAPRCQAERTGSCPAQGWQPPLHPT